MKQGGFETRPYIFASFALFAIRFFLLRAPFGFAQAMSFVVKFVSFLVAA